MVLNSSGHFDRMIAGGHEEEEEVDQSETVIS